MQVAPILPGQGGQFPSVSPLRAEHTEEQVGSQAALLACVVLQGRRTQRINAESGP